MRETITLTQETACETCPSTSPRLEIANYELLHICASGQYGDVYVARNRSLPTLMRAVKVIHEGKDAQEREAHALYMEVVEHEALFCLTPIYDFGQAKNGQYYYVMRLADDLNGPATLRMPEQYQPTTLGAYLAAHGKLPLGEILLIANQMLLALCCLHRHGLIHSDLKPDNILLIDGKWRLGDFGIMIRRAHLRANPDWHRGTCWFKPNDATPDFNVDVYALGKTLFQLATDIRPQQRSSDADPFVHFDDHWGRVSAEDENLKEALAQIIRRACHAEPLERFQSAAEMHQAVSAVAAQTSWVQLRIPGDFNAFTDEDQKRWEQRLAEMGLHILEARRKRGSILLQIKLSAVQGEYLLSAVRAGKFSEQGVHEALLIREDALAPPVPAQVSQPQPPRSYPAPAQTMQPLALDSRAQEPSVIDPLDPWLSREVRVEPTSSTPGRDKSELLRASIGRYKLVRRLRQGGMGSVWLAQDENLHRLVALKVPRLAPEHTPEIFERFRREAETAASLQHPNICPIYDFGESDGLLYLTMPFVEGQQLSDLIDPERLWPTRQATKLARKLAEAIAVVHERGIIHRDLKPSNIMLQSNGEPMIMDFGLARSFHESEVRLTTTGMPVGTPSYMSPEQVDSDSLLGPGTDIYSLGVIFYQLLTGRPPFQGKNVYEIFYQIQNEPPTRPSELRPEVDRALDAICLRALEKPIQDRFESMGDFAVALNAYLLHADTSSVGCEAIRVERRRERRP